MPYTATRFLLRAARVVVILLAILQIVLAARLTITTGFGQVSPAPVPIKIMVMGMILAGGLIALLVIGVAEALLDASEGVADLRRTLHRLEARHMGGPMEATPASAMTGQGASALAPGAPPGHIDPQDRARGTPR